MTEIQSSESTPSAPPVSDEVLKLKCPTCGGGLNLKRKFLGLKGQCVHCRNPLTAIEENGVIRVVTERPAAAFEEAASAPAPVPQSHAAIPSTAATAYAAPLPTRPDDNLFPPLSEPATAAEPAPKPVSSPFGESQGFAVPFASTFGDEDPAPAILPAWGANIPKENHASLSPFGSREESGSSFADSLFRPKGETTGTPADSGPPASFASPFVPVTKTDGPAPAKDETPAPDKPKRDCEEKVILDGDGRPLRPMTKEEEEEFAKNFFKYENARTKPRWVKRILRKVKRMLIGFCLLGGIAAVAACFVPKEKLLTWKKGAIEWLEPGMAVLDYLPEKLRPKWLPQSKFGIDAGVDEKGQPKKKLNAFEGLDKLKGDVGNMRGAADKQLKELNNF
jgi:hypothetical protein